MLKRIFITIVCLVILLSNPVPLRADDPHLTGTLLKDTITHNGMERSFLAYMPDGDISGRPVIMVLHGSKGTGHDIRGQSGYRFDVLSDTEKFLVVYPDGYKKHWNDCRNAPSDAAHREDVDDVGFILALAEMCTQRWGTGSINVFAAGFSNGAHMCYRLAIEAPDRIAGIAAVAAGMPAEGWSRCPVPQKRLPVMIINGTEDPINPYEGGMVKLFLLIKKGKVLSSMESARVWLLREDLAKEPVIQQMEDLSKDDNSRVEILAWPGSQVRLYTVHGGGHTIPGGRQYLPVMMVGRTNQDMDIAQEVWNFLVVSR
ncbi:MAG TPA: polyhydroxybutyrate depolymerase [Deltaproteobacteria bacterium]|nr:polyhydroxybutyrate depolymerase [Deltaproteobacteria bacterium]